MSFKIIIYAAFLVFAGFATSARADSSECYSKQTAPFNSSQLSPAFQSGFLNPNRPWNGTDTGIITTQFIGLHDRTSGQEIPLGHGSDLSASNPVDYGVFQRCHIIAAILRMDPSFTSGQRQLSASRIAVIPYYYMSIPNGKRYSSSYGGLSNSTKDQTDQTMAAFEQVGADQLAQFNSRMRAAKVTAIPTVSLGGTTVKFIALDVEEKLIDEGSSSSNARVYYGRAYARAVCTWVKGANKEFPDATILIYTTPSVFSEYLTNAYPEDNDCIHGLPVWLARTTPDAGDVIGHYQCSARSNSLCETDQWTERLCIQNGGNRCIVHQYSHRGILWSSKVQDDAKLKHVDLDRFFPLKVVSDSVGKQYIRQ